MMHSFEPLPDITPYELAIIVSRLAFNPHSSIHKTGIAGEFPDDLPAECRRHFQPRAAE